MKVSIFGTGYVGLVTGTCLADVGHEVLCIDIDEHKVQQLQAGNIPIYEPGLQPMVQQLLDSGNLQFSHEPKYAANFGDVLFIAVGTPPKDDGSVDFHYITSVAQAIGQHITSPKVVVNKSTVPVGSADRVRATIQQELDNRGLAVDFDVVSNPEFLKEGAAINDFMKPDRIVVGTESDNARAIMDELYAPFNRNHYRTIFMDTRSAELTKYAANAMLATKISFINEISNLAEKLGADIENIRKGIGADPRIGYQFIYPGCGYGGSCFPKDVRALAHTGLEVGYQSDLLTSVSNINERQKLKIIEYIHAHFGVDNLAGKTFALWGLAFKPRTDDMREAPSRVIMESLWQAGAKVQAYDPKAMEEAQRIYGDHNDLSLHGTKESALKDANALIICTEWPIFKIPSLDAFKKYLKDSVIFDGRNLYEPEKLEAEGLAYYGIGRGLSIHSASNKD